MIKIGDRVQWTINGVDQFPEPRKVQAVSECRGWYFVEGSSTGLPLDQLTVIPQIEEKYTFFYSGPFSQWHPCRFVVEKIVYSNAEQFMMAGKARFFEDHDALRRIMKSVDPSVHKILGRRVRNFDQKLWNEVARDIVYQGNHAKFTQNPSLLKKLLETRGTTLVEASPHDRIWGIGLTANDPLAQQRSTWQGTNWLGETLTRLRDNLIKEVRDEHS
jgi:ribA/ribD-fused uncharacterized protein